jgi:hypothetical protein
LFAALVSVGAILPLTMNTGDLVGGKYRITQRLGAGAMGTVWAAIDERTGRKVALELIHRPTDDLRSQLLREARAASRLHHRNTVEIHDAFETESGDVFLVKQLLSGETLAKVADARATAKTVPEMRPHAPPVPVRPAAWPAKVAARVPVSGGAPRLYAAVGAGAVLTGALLVLLVTRSSTPVAVAPPISAPISVAPGEAPASPAESPAIPTATGQSPVERAPPAALAVTATSPLSKAPPPRAPRPEAAAGAPLQPCSRFLRKNCRLVQP